MVRWRMAQSGDRWESLETVRSALFLVGKSVERLAGVTEQLEELYARHKVVITPDHFYVMAEPDDMAPEWARRARKRAIDVVTELRARVETAEKAVIGAAAYMDGPHEPVDQSWSTRIGTDLRAVRSEIVRGQPVSDLVSLLPLPGAGVPAALSAAMVPVHKHMLAVKWARDRMAAVPAGQPLLLQRDGQGGGDLELPVEKSARNRLLARIHAWSRLHPDDLAFVVDRLQSRYALAAVNTRIANKEPIYGGFEHNEPLDPTTTKPGTVLAWRTNMVVGELLAHPPSLNVDSLDDPIADALRVVAIICLLTDPGADDYMDWDLARVPFTREASTGMGRGWNVWKDADCPYWPDLAPLALAAIDLLDTPPITPVEALRLLGTKREWSITRLPPGVSLDQLRQLDQRGWILMGEKMRQHLQPGSTAPRFAVGSWASPIRESRIHGDWRHHWSKRTSSEWEQPSQVRLSDSGSAALAELSMPVTSVEVSEKTAFASPPKFAHAEDFTWIVWNSKKYDLAKGNQSEAVKALWGEWEKSGRLDGCGLSEKTIGEKCGSSANDFRLALAFRDHPAWATVIRSVSKGVFALFAESPQNHTS